MKMLSWLTQNKKAVFFCLGIAALSLYPLFTDGGYRGHDLLYHLGRINGIKSAWADGQLIPKIYPYMNYGFGYASPLFYSDLFLFVPAVLYTMGVSLFTSYKIFVGIVSVLTAFAMFYSTRKILNSNRASYISTALYMFSTYRIIDLYARAALGEVLALLFVPIALAAIYSIVEQGKNDWMQLALAMTGLLLVHIISFVLVCILIGVYLLLKIRVLFKNKAILIIVVKAAMMSLVLSMFFLLPMMEQMKVIDLNLFHINTGFSINEFSQSITQLFVNSAPLGTALAQWELFGKMNVNLGTLITILPILVLLPKFKTNNEKNDKFIVSITIVGYVLLLMTTTAFNWDLVPVLRFIQFPWRLMVLALPLLCVASAAGLTSLAKNINSEHLIITVCFFSFIMFVSVTEPLVLNEQYISEDITVTDIAGDKIKSPDKFGTTYNANELMGAEYLPFTYEGDLNYKLQQGCIYTTSMECVYTDYYRNGTNIIVEVDELYEGTKLMFPITYYKGYEVYRIDENRNLLEKMKIEDASYYHLVSFNMGDHTQARYMLVYETTLIQKISCGISLVGLIFLGCYYWRKK